MLRTCCKRRPACELPVHAVVNKLPAGGWIDGPTEYVFEEEQQRSVGSWNGVERRGAIPKTSGRSGSCKVSQLVSFLSQADVCNILERVKASAAYEEYLDSIDNCPVFEYYLVSDGKWQDEEMKLLLSGFIEGRLLPYVREEYSCPTCALDNILVRRYVPGERRTLGLHFDVHAYVTAVLGVTDPSEYSGGLYLQPGVHASSRKFFCIEPGDLVVHSFDLQHGVHMWSGSRYSIIFWIKDSPESVSSNTSPWYDALVEQEDLDAMYNVAQDCETGVFGQPLDMQRAMALYERSAAMGHHYAQFRLGLLLHLSHEESGHSEEYERGIRLIRAAAEQGFAQAQKTYALILASDAGAAADYSRAALWMLRAANQMDHEAANHVAEFCMKGYGVPRDAHVALKWYHLSAEAGLPEAQFALGTLYSKGIGVPRDLGQAVTWLTRAASQGSSKAKRRLATISGAGGK